MYVLVNGAFGVGRTSVEVVRARLAGRGEAPEDPRFAWVHPRAAECCAAHLAPEFAVQVPTEARSVEQVARDLADGLARGAQVVRSRHRASALVV